MKQINIESSAQTRRENKDARWISIYGDWNVLLEDWYNFRSQPRQKDCVFGSRKQGDWDTKNIIKLIVKYANKHNRNDPSQSTKSPENHDERNIRQ